MLSVGAARFWMFQNPPVEPLRLRRLPMLAAALAFAAGDLFARYWHGPALLLASTLVLLALVWLALRKAPRVVLVPAMGLIAAAGCWCAQMQRPVDAQSAIVANADGLSRMVRGSVVRVHTLEQYAEDADAPSSTDPGAWESDRTDASTSIDLDVSAIEYITPDISRMDAAKGGLRVTLLGAAPALHCGDIIEMPLRMHLPEVYRDPGAWSYRDYLLGEGIGGLATAHADKLTITGTHTGSWHCRLLAAQAWAVARLHAYVVSSPNQRLPHGLQLSEQDAGMLGAMLFGDRSALTRTLRTGFERTGTFHLFVVSGLHVALIVGGLMWLMRRLRVPDGAAVLTTIVTATAYTLLTGFGVPSQRALLMCSVYLLARWLGREVTALNALGTAAFVVLVLDPRSLFEASFQMTFLVILAIAGIGTPLVDRTLRPWLRACDRLDIIRFDASLHPRFAQFRVQLRMASRLSSVLLHPRLEQLPVVLVRAALKLCEWLLYSLAAEACMVVPMAVYFHRATLLALPVNFVVIPLLGFLLTGAVLTFVLALVSPWAAMLPGAITALLLHILHGAVDLAQRATLADIRVPAPAPFVLWAVIAALGFVCWAVRRGRWLALAGALTACAIPGAVLWPEAPLLHANALELTAIDVGQGDSLFLASPSGKTMLIDAGGPVGRPASEDRWDVGEEVVAPYLWSRRVRRLDVVVLTHAHSDHMGGMPAVLRDFRPRELWVGVQPAGSEGMRRVLAEARELGVAVRWMRAGDGFAWGGSEVEVLSPEAQYANAGGAMNDDSLVLRLSYGRGSVLLEGDAEARSEAAMVRNGRVRPTTLLKVGHHGSRTSTTEAFLEAVQPRDAVISVGRHNTFGHPRQEVLERLEAQHVATFRTDIFGAESFVLDSDGRITASSVASP